MSPRPPSTAPSIRWPGPPNNDYAVRWRTAPAIWLGASRTSSGRPWPPRNRSRLASPAPQLAAGARLGGRLCRTGRPVVATVRSAERRPRDGAGLCVNAGKSGTGWLCAPDSGTTDCPIWRGTRLADESARAAHIGGYGLSSDGQRELQSVMEERWLLAPDRRAGAGRPAASRRALGAQIVRLCAPSQHVYGRDHPGTSGNMTDAISSKGL